MKNKATIAVPYYNSSVYLLRKCLNSCLRQTYGNIEILVLVDGTPRDISSVIDEYSKNKKVKFLVSKKNLGVSAERNIAIKKASGDYLFFIDSDDYIDADMVEKMVNRMEQDDSDMVICGIADTEYVCDNGLFDKRVFFSFPQRFCHIQYTNFVANKMFKLDIIRKYSIAFDEKIKLGEDALFCQEYYKHVRSISCMQNKFYHYVRQDSSSTNKYDPNYYKYEKRVISAIEDNFVFDKLNDIEKQYAQRWHFRKVYMTYNHYFIAHREGKITKAEILDVYSKILAEDIFKVDTTNLDKNQFFKKGEPRTARNFKKNAKHVFMNMSMANGKRATIKALLSK